MRRFMGLDFAVEQVPRWRRMSRPGMHSRASKGAEVGVVEQASVCPGAEEQFHHPRLPFLFRRWSRFWLVTTTGPSAMLVTPNYYPVRRRYH